MALSPDEKVRLLQAKIDQILKFINNKDGLDNFTDEDVIKLLSAFNYKELDEFEEYAFISFGVYQASRMSKIIASLKFRIRVEVARIESSEVYKNFLSSIEIESHHNPGACHDYLKLLSDKHLADLKYYYSNKDYLHNNKDRHLVKIQEEAGDKILSWIKHEIHERQGAVQHKR